MHDSARESHSVTSATLCLEEAPASAPSPADPWALSADPLVAAVQARSHMAWWLRYVDPTYQPIWYADLIADRITRLRRTHLGVSDSSSLQVLLVRIAPQHGKTKLCCEAGPAFFATALPDLRSMALAYAAPLARRNIRAVTALTKTAAFRAISPVRCGRVRDADDQLVQDEAKAEIIRFMVAGAGGRVRTGPGYYLSAGVTGMLTGWSVDATWLDDMIRSPSEAWSRSSRDALAERMRSVVLTRLQNETTLCVSMTPWHPEDVSFLLQEECQAAGLRTEVLSFPAVAEPGVALHPEDPRVPGSGAILDNVRHDAVFYARQKRLTGPWWKPLYQLDVSHSEEPLVQRWAWSDYDPETLLARRVFPTAFLISVDPNADEGTTSPAHISTGVTVVPTTGRDRSGRLWKLEEQSGRWSYAETWARLHKLIECYAEAARGVCRLEIIVERKALGPALCQAVEAMLPGLRAHGVRVDLHSERPTESKTVRARNATAPILAGLVMLPVPDKNVMFAAKGRMVVRSEPCDWREDTIKSWAEYDPDAPGISDRVDADGQMITRAMDLRLIDAAGLALVRDS